MSELTFYTAPTANGYKVSIALEELGVEYLVRHLRFEKDEHISRYKQIYKIE